MSKPRDQKDREEMATRLDNSYLVEAGAGTGKTTVLVDRIMGAIRNDKSISKIAAITFTEKAAGELLQRIRSELNKSSASENDIALWKEARDRIETAPVGTIHSFCASLLRKRPIEAGVDPNFEVMDNVESEFLFEKTWKDWIATHLDKEQETLVNLLQAGVSLGNIKYLSRSLLRDRDLISAYKSRSRIPKPDFEKLLAPLERLIAEAQSLKRFCIRPDEDKGYIYLESLSENCKQIISDLKYSPYLNPLDFKSTSKNMGNKNNWKPKTKKDDLVDLLRQFAKAVEEYCAEAADYLSDKTILWLSDFVDTYQSTKETHGRLDFHDLLLKTRDMLAGDGELARAYFQRAFDLIMVDEFQDTDPLQVEIALLLSESKPLAESWDEVRPAPGKLFLVGDLKQSIYRFRRADIEMYKSVKEKIGDLKTISLIQNFRSCPELVDWFNACFEELFNAEEISARQPRYEKLFPPPDYIQPSNKRTRPGVWALPVKGLDYADNKPNAEEIRKMEAQTIAHFLKNIKQEIEVRDIEKKQWRPIEWKDIALLFRSRTGLNIFADALRSQNIPFVAPGAGGYFDRPECRALIACLMAVDKPDDAVALIGALRSPFFGLSDQDILRAKLAGIKFDYTIPFPKSEEPILHHFKILKELHEKRNSVSATGIIGELFAKTCVIALYALEKSGSMQTANLLKMQEIARQFDSTVGASFGSFIDYLIEYEADSKLETAAGLATDEPYVKLMTVHGAKGLEFPMVILADMTGDESKKTGACIIDRKQNNILIKVGNIESKNWGNAQEEEKEIHRTDEGLRLLYVACTRARDYLVAPVPEVGIPNGFSSKAIVHIKEKWADKTNFYTPVDMPSIEKDVALMPDEAEIEIASKHEPEKDPLNEWREAHKKLINDLSRPKLFLSVTDLAKRKKEPELKTAADDHSTDLGNFAHELLEKLDFAHPEMLEELAKMVAPEYRMEPDDVKLGVNMVERALRTQLLKRAMKSKKLKREFRVQYMNEKYELISGKADLVFEEEEKLWIVDYKTDKVHSAEEANTKMEEGYREQGRLYAEALEKSTGMKVAGAFILFLSPDSPIDRPCL